MCVGFYCGKSVVKCSVRVFRTKGDLLCALKNGLAARSFFIRVEDAAFL